MLKFLALIPFLLWFGLPGTHAQTLSPAQLTTLCTACKADTACNTPRLIGDAGAVGGWLNAARAPVTLAWRIDMQPMEIDQAADYSTYDSVVAGKRDAWALFIRYPRNFSVNKTRKVVTDVWGAATAASVAEGILQAATFSASNAQNAIGGTTRTTGTVAALDLTFPYRVNQDGINYVADSLRCQ